jgi:glycosyltransferase involved in cell wall biosynthesis
MLKVLHLYSGTCFWGPDRQLLQLYEPLRTEGVAMTTCVLYRHGPGLPQVHPLVTRARERDWPAEQIKVQARFSWPAIRFIAHWIREEGFTVIHSHEYKSNLYGCIAARLAGVRRVASVRGYTDRTWALRLYKQFDLITLHAFDTVLAVSEHLRQWLIRHGLPAARIVTAHDALDLALFTMNAASRAEVRLRFGIRDNHFVVTTVGRLSPEKGHCCLLEATRSILNEYPDARFMIVGDGPLRDQLEQQAKSLGINTAVILAGYQPDVAGFLSASDLFVLPSLREGTPNALLEAMALAKPVVVSRVGGVPEIVQDGETGLLVPPQDSSSVAQAVLTLMHDPNRAAAMGQRARRVIEQNFNAQRLAQEIAAVYHKALTKAR